MNVASHDLLLFLCCYCVFFFKQKTAYEMRISDWSSDVCSSDLPADPVHPRHGTGAAPYRRHHGHCPDRITGAAAPPAAGPARLPGRCGAGRHRRHGALCPELCRSEEHTSELQSLMRISYAVFCLKKKQIRHLSIHSQTHLVTTKAIKSV